MTDDGIKITVRMGTEDFQAMDAFMVDHDLENKSIFVRDAIRAYMESYDSPKIRRCVLEKIVPKTIEEEAYADSFRTAQRNAALK